MEIFIVLFSFYLLFLLGCSLGRAFTGFIRPKGLWNLVPFRVSGWRSSISGKVYEIKWAWDDIKFI
jgi:hypothetical protein